MHRRLAIFIRQTDSKTIYIFSNDSTDTDVGVKSFCQSEYGKDWYWAYNSYKTDGKFPTIYKVKK